MSAADAVADVTRALRRVLAPSVERAVPGARVTTLRPDQVGRDPQDVGVNLWLFGVTPSGVQPTVDLPTRAPDGRLLRSPRAAIELDLLLTFYGDDSKLQTQVLLAAAVAELHARPVLPVTTDGDPVRVRRVVLDLEELHRLWSLFHPAPYQLSLVYRASLVLLDSGLVPDGALPVRVVNATPRAGPAAALRVDPTRVEPGDAVTVSFTPAASPTALVLGGWSLAVAQVPGWTTPEPGQVRFTLDDALITAAAIPPGPLALAVDLAGVGRTDAVPVLVVPRITLSVRGHSVDVGVVPAVPDDATPVLELVPLDGQADATALGDPRRTAGGGTLIFDASGLAAGRWLVRLVCGGVATAVTASTATGPYDGPAIHLRGPT